MWCALVASECMAGRARSHGGDGCEKEETLMLVGLSLLGCALSRDCDVAGSHWSSLEGLSSVALKSSCCRWLSPLCSGNDKSVPPSVPADAAREEEAEDEDRTKSSSDASSS